MTVVCWVRWLIYASSTRHCTASNKSAEALVRNNSKTTWEKKKRRRRRKKTSTSSTWKREEKEKTWNQWYGKLYRVTWNWFSFTTLKRRRSWKRKKINRLVKLKKNHFHKVHKQWLKLRRKSKKKSALVSLLFDKDGVIRVDMKSKKKKLLTVKRKWNV